MSSDAGVLRGTGVSIDAGVLRDFFFDFFFMGMTGLSGRAGSDGRADLTGDGRSGARRAREADGPLALEVIGVFALDAAGAGSARGVFFTDGETVFFVLDEPVEF